ncbi:MAG TPA: helix-turn-helix transcriptional regulator, partial [Clostridiaceae bacterium]|nr:helix-turn-helix transcriptional regulator [Clostridiaceae bacterium]
VPVALLKIRVKIGVGRIYADILDISTSFNEALFSLDYNLIKGSEELLFFEDIIEIDDRIYWYPVEQQTRLIKFLRQGDIDMFNSELSKICDTIKKRNNSTGMIKAICFGIVNCIINVVNELDTEEFTDEVEDMLKFKSLEELQDRMKKMAASICNFINEKKQCGNEALKNAMLEFIHENYTENGLCLDMLAEELNLTSKYLSKVFKEQVGCRFGDYVRQIRIKNAKKLLIDTDMTIKEIVSEIGYGDTANFIRTFRIFEGVTPGDFRKIRS